MWDSNRRPVDCEAATERVLSQLLMTILADPLAQGTASLHGGSALVTDGTLGGDRAEGGRWDNVHGREEGSDQIYHPSSDDDGLRVSGDVVVGATVRLGEDQKRPCTTPCIRDLRRFVLHHNGNDNVDTKLPNTFICLSPIRLFYVQMCNVLII